MILSYPILTTKKDASESRDRDPMRLLAAHIAKAIAATVEAEPLVFAVLLKVVAARWIDSLEANVVSTHDDVVPVDSTWQERWN